ncbi:alpha/beta hydrolase [Thauera sp.]|uniref:alpha/beta fold hydrolase n=1 Tax=Thauera sp. TaxID=1905334 RepID=UPI002A360968|nr:alpha/beta hydrolase [Thauera sp.]MDX9886993.1 alpha/beta hydrolase [Thauera sp.]
MAATKSNDRPPRGKGVIVAGVAAALAATAGWVASKARRAEEDQPPQGAFVDVDGVRVHYLDRGRGKPVVLLHGNAVRLQDFVASGLIDRLAQHYRVVAFDRPGFGYSERPRDRLWTAEAQAELLHEAMAQLGLEQAVVIGHSWGTLVALELALREDAAVQQLILVSGYYFPTARADAALVAPVAIPVLGDVMRYTVSAVFARLLLGQTVKAMFAPQPVPADFLPVLVREMLVRPVQIRANAEDAAFMVPAAAGLRERYDKLTIPVTIFAGEADKVVDPEAHARRLHAALSNSDLHIIPGLGHMLHHAVPEQLVAAVRSNQTTAGNSVERQGESWPDITA